MTMEKHVQIASTKNGGLMTVTQKDAERLLKTRRWVVAPAQQTALGQPQPAPAPLTASAPAHAEPTVATKTGSSAARAAFTDAEDEDS